MLSALRCNCGPGFRLPVDASRLVPAFCDSGAYFAADIDDAFRKTGRVKIRVVCGRGCVMRPEKAKFAPYAGCSEMAVVCGRAAVGVF